MYKHNVLLLSVVRIQLVFVFVKCELCSLSLKDMWMSLQYLPQPVRNNDCQNSFIIKV